MNPSPERPLAPASSSQATLSRAAQDVSDATREVLLSARVSETRRLCALRVRVFGAWLEAEMLDAMPINVANYMAGPSAE